MEKWEVCACVCACVRVCVWPYSILLTQSEIYRPFLFPLLLATNLQRLTFIKGFCLWLMISAVS